MRLVHSRTFELKECFDDEIPEYAILSHTWANEEVTFQDMQNGTAEHKAGYRKIQLTARQAGLDGFDWFWVDTCSIDKTSSAELSEAIYSMFTWYQGSKVCYAYLVHVAYIADIPQSRYFQRGWTLQELLAPLVVRFYSGQWGYLGQKRDDAIVRRLLRATQIDDSSAHVSQEFQPDEWCVAEKMSWAPNRKTTRKEDVAYSPLGLFNVNISPFYMERTIVPY